ncbi:winged helix domain-containing protein [Alsobacter metallidurans]|uniref:winged helix domain-containing protein n=1 Tax=Alsobacter metallidurans TaxID=340221 RepID=UPI0035312D49
MSASGNLGRQGATTSRYTRGQPGGNTVHLRDRHGGVIGTIVETHGAFYRGRHNRYVLRCRLDLLSVERRGREAAPAFLTSHRGAGRPFGTAHPEENHG